MAFVDHPIDDGLIGKTVSGLAVSQPAAMQLQVATGSVLVHQTGTTYTLATAQSHTFTSDSTYKKQCFVALVDNGTTTDIWVDEYLDDGTRTRADPPTGYSVIQDLAWFEIAVSETNIVTGGTVNRRTFV